MTATLLHELAAVGGHVALRGEQLIVIAPPRAIASDLIERLRAAKPAPVANARTGCARCGGPDLTRRPLLSIVRRTTATSGWTAHIIRCGSRHAPT